MKAIDEAGKHHNNKGDEDAINFRPSSNFKYMKKYYKGKGESSMGTRGEEEGGVQPPLPRDPPPPESPPAPLVTPKLELEEEEYVTGCEGAEEEGKERVMCRQFARGACTRGQACIYAHEIILSQLPGIYTFCRDYQNTTCSFPRCKFVHATVFEKEYFYRTGFLPPHAIKHLKEGAGPALVPPAQVPPAPHLQSLPEGRQAEVQAPFPNPAPASLVHPGAGGLGGAEARPSAEALPPHAITSAAAAPACLKHDYRDMDELSAAAAAPAAAAVAAAAAARESALPRVKCSNCDVIEFRRQCQRNKAEKLRRSIQELDKKTALLEKKRSKQLAVLLALGRHSSAAAAPGSNSLINKHRNDKQKAILDKLNVIFAANGGHPTAVEENSNKILSTALVQLLLASAEATPAPPDAP